MSDFEIPSEAKQTLFKASSSKKSPTPVLAQVAEPEAKKEDEKPEVKPKSKYSEADLDLVFDSLMFEKEYRETVSLRKGKLKIVLRSRSSAEVNVIMNKLDALGANLSMTHGHYQVTYNLIYSLVGYQGTDLGNLSLEDKEKFIGQIPGPVLSLLIMALQEFDQKVAEATRYGEENF